MKPAVFDASVAVKALLAVPGHDAALIAIGRYAMVAPAFIVTEVANVIWKYFRRGDIDLATSLDVVRNFSGYPDLRPDTGLHVEAMSLATRFEHPVYDCLYLALARDKCLPLISADKRMLTLARDRLGLEVIPLDSIISQPAP